MLFSHAMMRPIFCLALLLASAVAPMAQEPAPAAPAAAAAPVPVPAVPAAEKPDAAEVARELEWVVGDYAAFAKLLERAKAAGIPEMELLLPQLDAAMLYGDVAKVKEFLPNVDAAKAEIIKKKGGTDEAREEVLRSLKLSRLFLAFAEKRPAESAKRAEMFRLLIFAMQTLEDARMVDAALDQLAIEKNLQEGTVATWDQLRAYVAKSTQLHTTGATLLGDKFGPFKVGTVTPIPAETFAKLRNYLPSEAWEDYAPK